jgi:hypothetical protein
VGAAEVEHMTAAESAQESIEPPSTRAFALTGPEVDYLPLAEHGVIGDRGCAVKSKPA